MAYFFRGPTPPTNPIMVYPSSISIISGSNGLMAFAVFDDFPVLFGAFFPPVGTGFSLDTFDIAFFAFLVRLARRLASMPRTRSS
jgi:hypothetical protein